MSKLTIPLDNIRVVHTIYPDFLKTTYNDTVPKGWKKISKIHYECHIKDSIHVKQLKDMGSIIYSSYSKQNNRKGHTSRSFKQLCSGFDIDLLRSHNGNKIVLDYDKKSCLYRVIDGVERLAIMFYRGLVTDDSLPIEFTIMKSTINGIVKIVGEYMSGIGSVDDNRVYYGKYGLEVFGGSTLRGKRSPKEIMNVCDMYVSFKGNRVVDYGCETGGMCFQLTTAKAVLGIDSSAANVAVAKTASTFIGCDDQCNFARYMFDKQSIGHLANKVIPFKPDISLLLSTHEFLSNWKEVYLLAAQTSDTVVVEAKKENVDEIIEWFQEIGCKPILIKKQSTDDITHVTDKEMYTISTAHIEHQ